MILYLLNIADLCFTYYVTRHGGIELNPVVNFLLEWHLFGWFKICFTVPLIWWLKDRSLKAYWAVTAFYGAVVAWHIIHFIIFWRCF